ncbi:MAG: sugar transferase [Anaerolineae bacterium]|nr:MAG: sugar transferase [Anaerolineae bacterium]
MVVLERMLDLIRATVGLVLTAPLMLVIDLMIRLTMGSSIPFRQKRPGLYGKLFTLLRFRTRLVLTVQSNLRSGVSIVSTQCVVG